MEKLVFEKGVMRMNELGSSRTPFLFMVDYQCENCLIREIDKVDKNNVLYNFNGKTNHELIERDFSETLRIEKFPILKEKYRKAFDFVFENIHNGNSFLLNLTVETPIKINRTIHEVFEVAKAKYKLWLKDEFVCFSPEIFVKISDNGIISSYPMKGTADANLLNASEILLSDRKELWEHTTIVDLIRNDLSRVADKVWVEKFRYLDTIRKHDGRELLQMSSQVCGVLEDKWHQNIGTILEKLLPAGSITGAPKTKTIEIISEAEKNTYHDNSNRRFYTGVMGIYDGKSLDSGVMIRFIENTPNGLVFKSGGGITFASEMEKEYNEIIQKIYVPF